MEDGWIEPELQLAPRVAAQCPVFVEITFAQCHMEAPTPEIGRKREDTAAKECLSVTRGLASHKKRAEPTVRKYGRCIGIGQQRVIASAQFGLTNDVEGPLQRDALTVPNPRRS